MRSLSLAIILGYFCRVSTVTDIITRDFDLALGTDPTEKEMLDMLILRVTEMMEGDVDLLMSYLYRLDILEHDINAALQLGSLVPPNVGLAQLILDRQKQRLATKARIKVEPIDGWEY